MPRVFMALLIAALAYPTLLAALGILAALGGAFVAGAKIFAVILALGLPALGCFCRLQWWQPWRFAVGGTLGGALCALPFAGSVTFNFGFLVLVFALLGAFIALPFWVLAIWRNDKLTCPRKFCLGNTTYHVVRQVLRPRA